MSCIELVLMAPSLWFDDYHFLQKLHLMLLLHLCLFYNWYGWSFSSVYNFIFDWYISNLIIFGIKEMKWNHTNGFWVSCVSDFGKTINHLFGLICLALHINVVSPLLIWIFILRSGHLLCDHFFIKLCFISLNFHSILL